MYSHIVEDSKYYTSSIASAVNDAGILFVAAVINKPQDQYCVIKRIDVNSGIVSEVVKLHANDSRALILSEGGNPDPEVVNGKYGNVAISIHGNDIYIVLEMRYDGVNKQRWGVLRNKAL